MEVHVIAPGCKSAEIQAAVSSVAMSGRLVQFVRCWEMAAVVSGDRREFSSWVAGVASNAPALRWTAKRIEQQEQDASKDIGGGA